MKRLVLLLVSLLALPATASAQAIRELDSGYLQLGVAPGVNFGGHSLPRTIYSDALRAGYVFPNGLELQYALTGMNWFPDEDDWSITMNRFAIGWRPFMRDPLPMIQPYVLAGAGFGGYGDYVCEPEPQCDPAKDDCTNQCGRSHWGATMFGGGGIDFTSRLFDVGTQQLLLYVGVEARYEYVPDRYHMGVVTIPIGLRLL